MHSARLAVAVATGALAASTLSACGVLPRAVTDYDYYGSVEALDEAATVIIRGTVLASRAEAASSTTIHQIRITEQYQGGALAQGSVDVMQPGHVAANPRPDEALEVGEEYVLFLLVEPQHRGDPAGIVGGSQGTFLIGEDEAITQQFAANAGGGLTEEETVTLDWEQLEALRE